MRQMVNAITVGRNENSQWIMLSPLPMAASIRPQTLWRRAYRAMIARERAAGCCSRCLRRWVKQVVNGRDPIEAAATIRARRRR